MNQQATVHTFHWGRGQYSSFFLIPPSLLPEVKTSSAEDHLEGGHYPTNCLFNWQLVQLIRYTSNWDAEESLPNSVLFLLMVVYPRSGERHMEMFLREGTLASLLHWWLWNVLEWINQLSPGLYLSSPFLCLPPLSAFPFQPITLWWSGHAMKPPMGSTSRNIVSASFNLTWKLSGRLCGVTGIWLWGELKLFCPVGRKELCKHLRNGMLGFWSVSHSLLHWCRELFSAC